MGQFTWTCAKTNMPVLAAIPYGRKYPDMCEVTLFGPNGVVARGRYDGAGHIDDLDLTDSWEGRIHRGEAKIALTRYLKPGDSFATLGRSVRDAVTQGMGIPEAFVEEMRAVGGFASPSAYALAARGNLSIRDATGLSGKDARKMEEFHAEMRSAMNRRRLRDVEGAPDGGLLDPEGMFMVMPSFSGRVDFATSEGKVRYVVDDEADIGVTFPDDTEVTIWDGPLVVRSCARFRAADDVAALLATRGPMEARDSFKAEPRDGDGFDEAEIYVLGSRYGETYFEVHKDGLPAGVTTDPAVALAAAGQENDREACDELIRRKDETRRQLIEGEARSAPSP